MRLTPRAASTRTHLQTPSLRPDSDPELEHGPLPSRRQLGRRCRPSRRLVSSFGPDCGPASESVRRPPSRRPPRPHGICAGPAGPRQTRTVASRVLVAQRRSEPPEIRNASEPINPIAFWGGCKRISGRWGGGRGMGGRPDWSRSGPAGSGQRGPAVPGGSEPGLDLESSIGPPSFRGGRLARGCGAAMSSRARTTAVPIFSPETVNCTPAPEREHKSSSSVY